MIVIVIGVIVMIVIVIARYVASSLHIASATCYTYVVVRMYSHSYFTFHCYKIYTKVFLSETTRHETTNNSY